MRALITGATGFIGRRLLGKMQQPTVLTRNPARSAKQLEKLGAKIIPWEPQSGPPPAAAFEGIDCIFHLAGEAVASGRWTAKKKARIRDSRIIGTRNLVAALRALPARPKALISASAV